jgi:hypothetical protein
MRRALLIGSLAVIAVVPATLATAAPPAPTVITGIATGVTSSGATLQGTVNPQGQATTYSFQYGPSTTYGSQTTAVGAGSGTADVAATAAITGLASGTTYHYRLVAQSPGGTSYGGDQTMSTLTLPAVKTGSATKIDESSATLSGVVNPRGQATTDYFQFGTSIGYGLQTAPAGAGAGTADVAVSAGVAGLAPGTTYHYRTAAQSKNGTSFGGDGTFKTSGVPAPTARIALIGTLGFVSSGGWVGPELACFGQARCAGQITISRGSVVLGQRGFAVSSESAGVRVIKLTDLAQRLLRKRHHLVVQVIVTGNAGQTISQFITLVRWS